MGCLGGLCRSLLRTLNGFVILDGLAILGIGLYFLVRHQQNDGLFGEYSMFWIVAPVVMGLLVTMIASCCCCTRTIEEKSFLLFVYSFILLGFGFTIAFAGAMQVVAIGYQEDISKAADLSLLDPGFQDYQRHLSDYNLGVYNKCCLANATALYVKCPGGAPECFHDTEWFEFGLESSGELCSRIVNELKFCPNPSNLEDIQGFNENIFAYVDSNFLIAAYCLAAFGSLLLLTCVGSCEVGKRNRVGDA